MRNKIGKCVYIGNIYTLEVVGRGSDTQLQVCKNVSSILFSMEFADVRQIIMQRRLIFVHTGQSPKHANYHRTQLMYNEFVLILFRSPVVVVEAVVSLPRPSIWHQASNNKCFFPVHS